MDCLLGAVEYDNDRVGQEQLEAARNSAKACHEDEPLAYDDVNGSVLDVKEVKKARAKELEYFAKMGVYIRVPLRRCWELT